MDWQQGESVLSLTAVVRSWGTCCAWLIDVSYADIRLAGGTLAPYPGGCPAHRR
jgi:hypothetical protein